MNSLIDFIGQDNNMALLNISILATKKTGNSLDHVLLYGSPGLGKTTVSNLISKELGTNFYSIHGGNIRYQSDLLTLITKIKEGDVLFIDEVHSIDSKIEEMLYSIMESFYVDVILGRDITSKPLRVKLPKFTLICATTDIGLLKKPLIDRFGLTLKFIDYDVNSITKILLKHNNDKGNMIKDEVIKLIAEHSRNTPRIALRLYNRISDLITVNDTCNTKKIEEHLRKMGVNKEGLTNNEIAYLKCLNSLGKMGLDTISMYLELPLKTIKNNVEPYLIKNKYITIEHGGRNITKKALKYLNLSS